MKENSEKIEINGFSIGIIIAQSKGRETYCINLKLKGGQQWQKSMCRNHLESKWSKQLR